MYLISLVTDRCDHVRHALAWKQDGASDWEKLKAYYASFEENVGKNEVDNIDVEEYGPHTVRDPTK